jgi:hypothetical protein
MVLTAIAIVIIILRDTATITIHMDMAVRHIIMARLPTDPIKIMMQTIIIAGKVIMTGDREGILAGSKRTETDL